MDKMVIPIMAVQALDFGECVEVMVIMAEMPRGPLMVRMPAKFNFKPSAPKSA